MTVAGICMVYFPDQYSVPTENTMSEIYDLEMASITGDPISFSDYREQALLIVNLASQ